MSKTGYSTRAAGLVIALTLSVSADAGAQTDTTRRPTAVAEQRIPVRKDQGITRRVSAGDVDLLAVERARIDSLEALAASYRIRIDSLSAAFTTRSDATDRLVASLSDSLRLVRTELTTARTELTTMSAHVTALSDTVQQVNQRIWRLRHGSLFGNSGFYVGVGSGTNLTTGTLDDIGYNSGLNVSVPIGWHQRGSVIGVRTEWGVQSFDGRNNAGFSNNDARFYSAVGLLTLNLPINAAKTNTFYVMGGGGVYMFKNLIAGTTLGDRFGATTTSGSTTSETKFGFQGGAGVELKILGATSFFVQTGISQVSVDTPAGTSGSSLRWVPIIAGIQLR
ncbi:MAG: hypothetical protein ACT4P6_02420 [Gemmatimonadaceae bacterium]